MLTRHSKRSDPVVCAEWGRCALFDSPSMFDIGRSAVSVVGVHNPVLGVRPIRQNDLSDHLLHVLNIHPGVGVEEFEFAGSA
jgi:hypothetical protein